MSKAIQSKIGANYRVAVGNPLKAAMTRAIVSGCVPMIWGPPGIGKSQVARSVAEDLGMEYIDVRANLLDPVDIRGIPWREGEGVGARTRWAPPIFFPTDPDKEWLINFDELSAAPPSVQAALYQVLLDRAIGETRLPESVHMMGAGNEEQDRAVSHRMGTATASRMRHIYAEVNVKSWLEWAAEADIDPVVMFFMHWKPDMLYKFDPRQTKEHAFPCPRTWEFVSKDLKVASQYPVEPEIERSLAVGTVGEEAGIQFMAFLDVYRQLPHPQTIIDDPLHAPIPKSPSAEVALCGSLYRIADDTNFDAIVTYAGRDEMRKEIGQFMVSQCVRKDTKLQYTKAYNKWCAKINQ